MATHYTHTKLPDEGVRLKWRGPRLIAYRITVEPVFELDVVLLHGKRVYVTTDGKHFTHAEEAKDHQLSIGISCEAASL